MSTQTGLHLEIFWKQNFVSHLRIKGVVCIGKPCICNAMCYVMGGALLAPKRDDLHQIYSKVAYGDPACIVSLYDAV